MHTHTCDNDIIIMIIIVVISVAPYLTVMGEQTMLYKLNKNVYTTPEK